MNLNIRTAEKADCPRLLELIAELALFEKAPEEVTVTLKEFEDAGFGKQAVWKAFTAEVDGFIVGFALYYIRYSTWKGRRMYLEDLIITEAYRSRGIGMLLIKTLIKEALAKGFSGMLWQVLDWNEPAIGFYKKLNASFDGAWTNVSLSKEQLSTIDLSDLN